MMVRIDGISNAKVVQELLMLIILNFEPNYDAKPKFTGIYIIL